MEDRGFIWQKKTKPRQDNWYKRGQRALVSLTPFIPVILQREYNEGNIKQGNKVTRKMLLIVQMNIRMHDGLGTGWFLHGLNVTPSSPSPKNGA